MSGTVSETGGEVCQSHPPLAGRETAVPAPATEGGDAPQQPAVEWDQQAQPPYNGRQGAIMPPGACYYMGAEYIPASWGPPPPPRAGSGFVGQPAWVQPYPGSGYEQQQQYPAGPSYEDQQQCMPPMWCSPSLNGSYPQQAYFMAPSYDQLASEDQQQQMIHVAQQQQYYMAAQPPLFAISPPQQLRRQAPWRQQQRQQQDEGRLARKKKAALPAEASFGCEGNFLADGGSSSVLLVSAEPSVADDMGSVTATLPIKSSREGSIDQAQRASQTSEGSSAESVHLRPPAGLLAAHSRGSSGSSGASPAQQYVPPPPSIVYDRAPRAVDWRPYSYSDYRQRNYDTKAAGKYWELGGLGPAHGAGGASGNAEWQAQQSKRERQQQFGRAASKQNRDRISGQPPRQPTLPKPRMARLGNSKHVSTAADDERIAEQLSKLALTAAKGEDSIADAIV